MRRAVTSACRGLWHRLAALLVALGCATGVQARGAPPPAAMAATPAAMPAAAPDATSAATPAATSTATPDGTDWGAQPAAEPQFDIEVQCRDGDLRTLLEHHLELYRYRALGALGAAELERLLARTEDNAADLLGTQGYFAPKITLTRIPAGARTPAARLPLIRIDVDPGAATLVADDTLDFTGDIARAVGDSALRAQRNRIRRGWGLRPGQRFTQAGWSEAKSAALTQLTARRYPRARIAASRATVDAATQRASLALTLDSGPRFRLGDLAIRGLARYDERVVRNFARLRPGADYALADILAAQQRLAESGYFDAVFLHVDPQDPDPQHATVHADVKEAHEQKLTVGPGYSTDSGPRITLDHRYNRVPLLGWQASTQVQVDRKTELLQTAVKSIPDDDYWRWVAAGNVQREDDPTETTTGGQASLGRAFTSDTLDRSAALQFDRTHTRTANGVDEVSAVSANFAWTLRRLNDVNLPTRGWGLGVDLGVGTTIGSTETPFTRVRTRALTYLPLPQAWRNGRIVLRGDVAGVLARSGTELPTTLLWRTGGDTTVRGYAYRAIGVRKANGVVSSGRYMTVASIEYQRPILRAGRPTAWEWAVFTDTGAVADKPQEETFHTGVGAGVRWRSPVGPLQIDLAYGLQTHEPRLHLNIGFTF